ncbi:MAG: MogA/MoaB family molybdenum cofactor biosynthesis protein [Planctomycetes bacterium]|nr:MogA/MoaB family molybdenum cofactor biosynthesis protein [Planctomycetota bacterium]
MTNRAVVITISDRCAAGQADDRSGPAIIEQLAALGAALVHREVIPDDQERVRRTVQTWIDRCELIVTTGGTGVSARDVTPEAIEPLVRRPLPGFGEVMRQRAFEHKPTSAVSRCGAGITGDTLILWLPGSPGAVRECLDWLAPAIRHTCQFLRGQNPH